MCEEPECPMQQTSLPLTPSHPLKGITGLARQIALPHEYAPVRFPSFPALERTALMGFCQPSTISVDPAAPTKVALFRQAAYPLWTTQPEASTTRYSFMAGWAGTTKAVSNATSQVGSWTQSYRDVCLLSTGAFGATTVGLCRVVQGVAHPTCLRPIMAIDAACGQQPFLYCPNGYSVGVVGVFNVNSISQAGTMDFTIEEWVAPGTTETVCYRGTAFGATDEASYASLNVEQRGRWLRVSEAFISFDANLNLNAVDVLTNAFLVTANGAQTFLNGVGNPQVTINNGASAITPFLPAAYPAEFSNSRLPWYAARTTASACLMSNVSQVLNKAGTVLAGRLSPNAYNAFSVESSTVNMLHPAEKAWLPLETGFYTFVPPSTDMASFWDYTVHAALVTVKGIAAEDEVPVFRLDNDSLYNVAFLTSGSVAETMALTLDWHIEFRTSSALFQIGLSNMTLESLHQAQLLLTTVGFFFENQNHKTILSKIGGWVKQYGPVALSALGAVNPMLAKGIELIANSRSNAVAMRPTTMEKSLGKNMGKPEERKSRKGKRNKKVKVARKKK